MPYYMAYPMPLLYDDERMERRDVEYMKSMFPMMAKRILPYVEEELDRMAYEGSFMYDEYPDRLQMQLMSNRIYDKVKGLEGIDEEMEVEAEQWRAGQSRSNDDWLRDLVQVLLFQELFRQRSQHRRDRRRFY